MLEKWIFMLAGLGFCLFGLFYGCMLLIVPNRCPAHYRWGQPSIMLVRKPRLLLGQRFLGLCLSIMMLFIFVRPIIMWMLHPVKGELIRGESPFSSGTAR